MRYLLTALLLLPALVSAQELHTFKNGEVADAEKINENFERVSKRIYANAPLPTMCHAGINNK